MSIRFTNPEAQVRHTERAQARIAICQECPERKTHPVLPDRCGLCGCVIQAKARIPGAKCPAGKW